MNANVFKDKQEKHSEKENISKFYLLIAQIVNILFDLTLAYRDNNKSIQKKQTPPRL